MTALSVKNLELEVQPHFWSAKKRLLHGVSFEVEEGEIFGFLGPNGAGKTTTMKAVLGLATPLAGEISVLGGSIRDRNVRGRIGFMPERAYFPEQLTSREVVRNHAMLAGMSWRDAKRSADEALSHAGLSESLDQRLGGHSKGMLQRVGIAQALVAQPDLIILDEPMSGLDPIGRRDMRNIMRGLRDAKKTVFFSTHILPDVEVICDRVAIMVAGRVQRVGGLHEMLSADAEVDAVDVTASRCSDETLAAARNVCGTVETHGDAFRFATSGYEEADRLMEVLRESGARILSLQPHRRSLEDVFVEETGASS